MPVKKTGHQLSDQVGSPFMLEDGGIVRMTAFVVHFVKNDAEQLGIGIDVRVSGV